MAFSYFRKKKERRHDPLNWSTVGGEGFSFLPFSATLPLIQMVVKAVIKHELYEKGCMIVYMHVLALPHCDGWIIDLLPSFFEDILQSTIGPS